LRAVYSAQCLTLDGGVLVDLRRAGGLDDADWWLAISVLLTEQVGDLLRRGTPTYLRQLTEKLEAKGASMLERPQSRSGYALRVLTCCSTCDLIGFDRRGLVAEGRELQLEFSGEVILACSCLVCAKFSAHV